MGVKFRSIYFRLLQKFPAKAIHCILMELSQRFQGLTPKIVVIHPTRCILWVSFRWCSKRQFETHSGTLILRIPGPSLQIRKILVFRRENSCLTRLHADFHHPTCRKLRIAICRGCRRSTLTTNCPLLLHCFWNLTMLPHHIVDLILHHTNL